VRRSSLSSGALNAENAGFSGNHSGPAAHPLLSKHAFYDRSIDWGFSQLIRELIFSEYLDLYQLQRYRHRLSIEGEPLYYFALGGRKKADVPASFVDSLEMAAR
jgi:hypothetical protein